LKAGRLLTAGFRFAAGFPFTAGFRSVVGVMRTADVFAVVGDGARLPRTESTVDQRMKGKSLGVPPCVPRGEGR
jgi:hypothetical protein